MTVTDWREIEREARECVRAALDAAEATPLVFGDRIAWVTYRFGRTDDLSPVHRVGYPLQGDPHTTCGEVIPAPISWMTLTPALIQSLDRCRFCEAEYARMEHAA